MKEESMTDGLKIEWEEPGPRRDVRVLVSTYLEGAHIQTRHPTEADLTRALELLAPEVRGRVIAKWRMRVDSQEAGEEIRDLKNRLALSERQVTIATASAYAARSPDHIVAAMREMPADVLERVLAPFAHEKGTVLVERRAAEVRAEKAERVAFEQQLALDDLRAKLEAALTARDDEIIDSAKMERERDELKAKLAEATTHPRSFVCDEEMRAALFADCAAATRRGDELEKERDELKAQLAASQSMERQVWRQILEAQRERDEAKDTIATLERTRCQIREALDAPERLTTPEAARRLLAERDVLRAQLEAVRKAAG